MGAKSVVRDVGRVMGLSYGECDRLAKMIPFDLKMTLEKALKQSPELKQAYETEEVTRELIDTAFILEDLTRNASVHAAGVVIGDQPLVNLLPLKQDEDGAIVTQYAMGPVGDLGLLKMDFLGPQDADGHPQHVRDGQADARHRGADRPPAAGRREDLRPAEQGRTRWACSSWNPAGCAICAASSRSAPSSTSRR